MVKDIRSNTTNNVTSQTFHLMIDKFADVLPFVLFYVGGEFLINLILNFTLNFEGFNLFLLSYLSIHVVYFLFCFILLLNVYKQIEEIHEIDLIKVVQNTICRFVPALSPLILLATASISIAVFAFLILLIFILGRGVPTEAGMLAIFIGAFIFGFLLLISSPFILVSTYRIAIKGDPIILGMVASQGLLKDYTIKSICMLFILILAKLILTICLNSILPISTSELTNLLFFPLTVCLIVTLSRNLERKRCNS